MASRLDRKIGVCFLAENLPFPSNVFDLVTCRIAPHHFDSIGTFLEQVHRVLKSDGELALVDNIVPAGSVGDYVNGLERLRDPSHVRALTIGEWKDALLTHGFEIRHIEELSKTIEFGTWTDRCDETLRSFLRGLIIEASIDARSFLAPQGAPTLKTLCLREGLFIAARA